MIGKEQQQLEVSRQSEALFRSIVEQAPMAIGVLSGPEMVLELANEAILRLWGKDRSAIGHRLIDFLPEIRGQGFIELLEEVYRSGRSYYGSEALARIERDGELIDAYFSFAYTPMQLDGSISSVMVLATEVTEQVNSREKIKQSQEFLTNMVLSAPMGICVLAAATLVPEIVNKTFTIIADKTAESLMSTDYWTSFAEVKEYQEAMDNVIRTGEPYYSDDVALMLNRHGRQELAHVNFVYTPIKNPGGMVEKVAVWVIENTAQVLARQQIVEAEAVMRGAVELAELGTWSIDLATRKLDYSERMDEWFGFDPQQESLNEFLALIDPADRKRIEEAVANLLEPGSPGHFDEEFTIIRRDTGKKRVLHAQGGKLRSQKIVGTAQDITMQRQRKVALEQEIRERTQALARLNADLNNSNEDLQQFAHVISHDLKEPIRKIKTFLGRLQEDPRNTLSVESLAFIGRMNVAAQRMSEMVEGVLKYSTIDTGAPLHQAVDLNATFHDILLDLEIMIEQKQASVLLADLPTIEGAPILIYQLFYNLLINSLKFTTASGQPIVRVKATQVTRDDIPFTQIEIRDNGIGFDQEHATRIFNTFARLNSKDSYEGTGLGLSLCKKIVQRHHGTIEAAGEKGKGALFTVLLPVKQYS